MENEHGRASPGKVEDSEIRTFLVYRTHLIPGDHHPGKKPRAHCPVVTIATLHLWTQGWCSWVRTKFLSRLTFSDWRTILWCHCLVVILLKAFWSPSTQNNNLLLSLSQFLLSLFHAVTQHPLAQDVINSSIPAPPGHPYIICIMLDSNQCFFLYFPFPSIIVSPSCEWPVIQNCQELVHLIRSKESLGFL
jgi:hypothetical protein